MKGKEMKGWQGSGLQLIEDPADGRDDDLGPLLMDGVVRVDPGDLGSSASASTSRRRSSRPR